MEVGLQVGGSILHPPQRLKVYCGVTDPGRLMVRSDRVFDPLNYKLNRNLTYDTQISTLEEEGQSSTVSIKLVRG